MPFDTPDNSGYLVAAYVVAAVIYLAYTASLWRRSRRVLREVGKAGGQRGSGSAGQ
jgi:hypothetical protein